MTFYVNHRCQLFRKKIPSEKLEYYCFGRSWNVCNERDDLEIVTLDYIKAPGFIDWFYGSDVITPILLEQAKKDFYNEILQIET